MPVIASVRNTWGVRKARVDCILHNHCSFTFLECFFLVQVIGLNNNGYGRILAECMFTSKIMYCLWATLGKEDDNFVIRTTKPLPKWKNMSVQEQVQFIKERILGRTNKQLAEVN